ncbi:MAG TPA: glycosyltransferase family 39 protein [Longimicrobiales bacterium]|nr:glycosyltransferase family 39 protein [Longimicrobiales bacterium]
MMGQRHHVVPERNRLPRQTILARTEKLVIGLVVILSVGTAGTAMRQTSATFDEIVFIAGGARGWETGSFDLAPDHPPLLQYLYGLPAYFTASGYPDEAGIDPAVISAAGYRYAYAKEFLWGPYGNGQRVILASRLVALAAMAALILVVWKFARRWGTLAGLLAAVIVAFLPDVLAHGGVAYGDLPLALGTLAAIWAIDRSIRSLRLQDAALAGALVGIAVGIKATALALLPAAALLLVAEAYCRRRDAGWRYGIAPAAAAASLAAYVALVIIFRGDLTLEQLRFGLDFRMAHYSTGHSVPAYLLGMLSVSGWWYFFPVAFLFKTSAGLHALMGLAGIQYLSDVRHRPGRLLASPLRAPLALLVILMAGLLQSNLNIGFRYALPALPLIATLTAVGVARLVESGPRIIKGVALVATAWLVIFPLTYAPNLLSFISEYGPGRDRNHEVLLDSSLDWGQGLIQLRDWMHANEISRIYLSYFGSAVPRGYGIDYIPMPSFFSLGSTPPASEPEPEWLVVSATNLAGLYLPGDPFAVFRQRDPDAIIAGSLLAFRLR